MAYVLSSLAFFSIRFARRGPARWGGGVVIIAMIVLAGCGTTRHHERYGTIQFEEWQADHEAKTHSIVDASIKRSMFDPEEGRFVLSLEQDYEIHKALYVQPVAYRRISKDPNLLYLLNPLLWLVCVDSPSACVGRDGEWGRAQDNGEREFVRTVEQEVRTGALTHPSAVVTVTVSAKDQTREWTTELQPQISNGQVEIDVKRALLESPFRPENFSIFVVLRAETHRAYGLYKYDSETVASLDLFSERWLTQPELYGHHMYQIRSCMESSDYRCAVSHFFKIQELDIARPASFYFHFAKALSLAGDTENARKAAQIYLRDPQNQRYRSQAQVFL